MLDIGCGRGAVLMSVAGRVPRGKAVSVDVWRAQDQVGNSRGAAERNAALEGVADRVELVDGDARSLPFPEASFDLVTSSLAIHNISPAGDRTTALGEAVRVLRPGGRLRIVDLHAPTKYADALRAAGGADVETRKVDWRMWFGGGPFTDVGLVSARKPS